jgi:universal stress protein A
MRQQRLFRWRSLRSSKRVMRMPDFRRSLQRLGSIVASALHAGSGGGPAAMTKSYAKRKARTSGTAFHRIIVPTDLTDRTVRALELASRLAEGRSSVTLLHVVQTVPGLDFDELRPAYEKLRARAARKMATLVRRVTSLLRVDINIAYGSRAETIVKAAAAMRADLIVLASHRVNPSMVGRDWGTLSYKVGILAQCPVLLVK